MARACPTLKTTGSGSRPSFPGGGAEKGSAPTGKVYVVLEGEITVTSDEGDVVLRKFDSCYIAPNTERSIINASNHPVQMLVISPN